MQIESKDNPYLAVVAKKLRNTKKKLDRILNAEAQLSSGKPLDEEQKVLFASKGAVEKSLADMKALLVALEEVAKEAEEKDEKVKEEKG
ncbi:hypothetical protein B484DRAFT_214953 [Ochromonadaceae sp. CCMP2298]|nr:hypothetical protein B484DRAFT_214953 [Ochromonadaceae sp. CCMP2298]